MARHYKRLRKEASSRGSPHRTNFVARLERLEMMLYELNARLIREAKQSEKLEDWDTDFLEAAEEFRRHLMEVHRGN